MDDAAALTEQMLEGLDQMVAQMNEMEQAFNLDPETAKRLDDAQKEMARLTEEQKRLTDETTKVRDGIQRRMDQEGRRIDEFAKRELEKVKRLREEIEQLDRMGQADPWMRGIVRSGKTGMEKDLAGLENGLKTGELGEALDRAMEIDSTLEGIESAGESMQAAPGGEGADPKTVEQASKAGAQAQEIVKDLEKLRRSFQDAATPEERQRLSELGKAQQRLRARTEGLGQEMRGISEGTPFVPPEVGQSLQGAANSMGEAADKLDGGNAAGAVPPERDAQSKLGQAQAQMEGGSKSGRGGAGTGMPLAQRLGQRPGRGEGMNGFANEKVEIPDGSQFRVPKEFRQDILEAMKKPSPNGYEQLNQEYYERLIK